MAQQGTETEDTIQCGSFSLKWNESISEMTDSSDLYDSDLPALQSRLEHDGYILLRDQIDPDLIDRALSVVADNLDETWQCLDIDDEHNKPRSALCIKDENEGVLLTGYRPITHHHDVQSLLHCDALITLMHSLFDQEPMTYDTKWVRVKGYNENTDEHADYYRFNDHCRQMVTVWMPLMDIPINKGPLAVCPGSHVLIDGGGSLGDHHETHDAMDDGKTDTELPDEFESFRESTGWRTTDFRKGDLLIFDIRTVHASLSNRTRRYRVSIDTRWQPRSAVTLMGNAFISFPRYLKGDFGGNESDQDGGEREMEMTLKTQREMDGNHGSGLMMDLCDCSSSESDDADCPPDDDSIDTNVITKPVQLRETEDAVDSSLNHLNVSHRSETDVQTRLVQDFV